MSQKVICPNCNEEFPLEEGLKNHLKSYEEKIKKEQSEKSKEEVKKLEKALKSKEKQISDARSEGEKSAANKLEENLLI